jgi:hypothetical protein
MSKLMRGQWRIVRTRIRQFENVWQQAIRERESYTTSQVTSWDILPPVGGNDGHINMAERTGKFRNWSQCNGFNLLEQPLRPGQNPSTTVPRVAPSSVAGGSAYAAQSHTAVANNTQFSHLPKLQYAIVTFIQSQHANDEGVHVGAIARAVGGTAVTIRYLSHSACCPPLVWRGYLSNALDTLMDDGLVFTTIDDSHFQIAAWSRMRPYGWPQRLFATTFVR